MTKTEWLQQLNECNGDLSQDQLINLVFKDSPNALWTDVTHQMHVGKKFSMYRYLTSLFPTRVWQDWQGTVELGSEYHAAYIPFDLSIFQRASEVCSPDSMSECHTDYCEVPRGGITHMPQLEMYKTGFKTKPMCIANIRTSAQAKRMAEFIVNERFNVEENVMNMFYVMALIKMLGHKWVLEYDSDGAPVVNNNPYNFMQAYRYSYMESLFPMIGDINKIGPLTLETLDLLGRNLTDSRNENYTGIGPRGEPIFELWHGSDWYNQEILDNPQYIERVKYMMETKLLNGYTNEPGKKEVVGNFSMKVMPNLPRFTESTQGGITIVQPMREVEVDSGNRAVFNYAEYGNAPFLLTVVLGSGIGEILTRPAINTGIEGKPILPITGNPGDPWQYRNDYDKQCNEDLNMPHFRKRFEMGFRMKNADAGWGFISRAKKFRTKPINTCDLRDIFRITPSTQACDSIVTIGCNPTNDRVSNNIITSSNVRRIACNGQACGVDTIWRLEFRNDNKDAIAKDWSPLGACGCGDTITAFIADADGTIVGQQTATVVEIFRPNVVNPRYSILVQLEQALTAGYCINSVACMDDSPGSANVIHCYDNNDDDAIELGTVKFVLDSPLSCGVDADVQIEYFDKDGTSLGTVDGTISSVNPNTLVYVIASDEVDFGCQMFDNQCTVVISCVV